jgi:hypothetical protein
MGKRNQSSDKRKMKFFSGQNNFSRNFDRRALRIEQKSIEKHLTFLFTAVIRATTQFNSSEYYEKHRR